MYIITLLWRKIEKFQRRELWRNGRWRLTFSTYRQVFGFCYIEPIRHIRYITELDGVEANQFGTVLSQVSLAIKTVAGSEIIYVYIFGDHIPHLHVHLALHKPGDPFIDDVVRGDIKFSEEHVEEEEAINFKNSVKDMLLKSL